MPETKGISINPAAPIDSVAQQTQGAFICWHWRNSFIHGASKRKITYEACNSSVRVSVAAAALSALTKQRPFLHEAFPTPSAQTGNDWTRWKPHRIREPELAWKLRCGPGALPNPSPLAEELQLSGHAVMETVNHWCEMHSYQSPIIAVIMKTSAGLQLLSQKRHCEGCYEMEMLFDSSLVSHCHRWRGFETNKFHLKVSRVASNSHH